MNQLAYQPHNHKQCIQHALKTAQSLCQHRGSRLTSIRKQVLEVIWQQHKPTGAYHIINLLGQDGNYPAPPTVYRALDFLIEQGLIHRIAGLNAYIGCSAATEEHTGCFFICRQCNSIIESISKRINKEIVYSAKQEGFNIENQTIEIFGLCPNCQS